MAIQLNDLLAWLRENRPGILGSKPDAPRFPAFLEKSRHFRLTSQATQSSAHAEALLLPLGRILLAKLAARDPVSAYRHQKPMTAADWERMHIEISLYFEQVNQVLRDMQRHRAVAGGVAETYELALWIWSELKLHPPE